MIKYHSFLNCAKRARLKLGLNCSLNLIYSVRHLLMNYVNVIRSSGCGIKLIFTLHFSKINNIYLNSSLIRQTRDFIKFNNKHPETT